MAFVRKVRTASGATAVQIAERRDGRDKVLEHIGSAHTEAELFTLVAKAKRRLQPFQDELDFLPPAQTGHSYQVMSKRSTALWNTLRCVYDSLGFDALADDVFAQLVLARLVKPTSKAGAVRVLDSLGIKHAGLRSYFRALARVQAEDYRSEVSRICYENTVSQGDLSLVLYDVTTLYFEAEREDDLRKVGYSKERRVDPQIVIGLLVDRAGFPLELTCWEPNKAETLTILPTIRQFQSRHRSQDLVVVADAGMLSAQNLAALDDAGLKFIVGSRQARAPVDLESHFYWNGDKFTDGQIIDTITPRHGNNKTAASDPSHRAEPVWDREAFPGSWRAVWAYSAKRARKDTRNLQAQADRAIAVISGDKTSRGTRFVKTRGGKKVLDEKNLERARRLVGLTGYLTNISPTRITASEIISDYHDLWHVEQSFRMSKHDLRARPIFHHTRDAIKAHLTIVMAALAVSRRLEKLVGLSTPRIVEILQPIQEITLQTAGHPVTGHDPLTPDAKTILDALNLTWPTH